MSRKKTQPKKNIIPDPKFNSTIIPKLINSIMYDGKKTVAEKIIYGALSSFHQFDNEDRNDLLQVIFLKLFKDNMKRISMWNKKAKFSTYLYKITTFCALDYLNSKYFKVTEKNISDPESEIDANIIFYCRVRHNRDSSKYEKLVNPLNSVILSKKYKRD